jgi:hypothetical protein
MSGFIPKEFFPKECLLEFYLMKDIVEKRPALLSNIKKVFNKLLDTLMYIVRKYGEDDKTPNDDNKEKIANAASKYFFWDEYIMGKLGQVGKDNPFQKWLYITDKPNNISMSQSTCRSKITILHNLWESHVGSIALLKFIIKADNDDKLMFPFIEQRKIQIYDLFNIRDDNKILYLLKLENLLRLRISWSQVDYMYPGVALRRIIQGFEDKRYVSEMKKRLKENIAKNNMGNIQKLITEDNPLRVYQGNLKWDLNMLIEPLSDIEKDLIKRTKHIGADNDITFDNYKFKPGAYYDRTLIMSQSPSDIQNYVFDEKCRVSGISGSCAIIADLCLLLQVNWKPVYLGLLVDYVPIHHSIREVLQTLNQMGFITNAEYDAPNLTVIKHANEIQNMNESEIHFDYTPYTKDITRGYKITLAVGGSNKLSQNIFSNRLTRRNGAKNGRSLKKKHNKRLLNQ